jgi:C-methyltransferase C-terminal domain/Putative zinc binding domain/Methyltransferase domain
MAPTRDDAAAKRCRGCGWEPVEQVLDLGVQPSATAFLSSQDLDAEERRWPLRVWICPRCWLLQLDDDGPDEDDGAPGLALVSDTMRGYARTLVTEVLARTSADEPRVSGMASHGNHLHALFEEAGVPARTIRDLDALGAGPGSAGPSRRDIDAFVDFYLLSHLREPRDFLRAVRRRLAPGGIAAVMFEHALPLVRLGRYDSIRHGHFSYLSLASLEHLSRAAGLDVVDAYRVAAYGGSIVAWLRDANESHGGVSAGVAEVRDEESAAGLCRAGTYRAWAAQAMRSTQALVDFLVTARADGRTVAGYGAPSRGNTLLNACGITSALLPFTVDRSPARQGRFLPGSHIPIYPPARLLEVRPDYLLILTWDLADEVRAGLPELEAWGGRFVIPVPEVTVLG